MQELNHHPKGEIETESSYLNATSESCQLANPPTPRVLTSSTTQPKLINQLQTVYVDQSITDECFCPGFSDTLGISLRERLRENYAEKGGNPSLHT